MNSGIIAILMLSGCSSNDATQPDNAAANITRPELDLGAATLPSDYIALRQASAALEQTGHEGKSDRLSDDEQSRRFFDVIDCSEDYRSVEPRDLPAAQANRERLAQRSVMLEKDLREAGYDSQTIAGPLLDYQVRMLAVIAAINVPPEPDLPAYYNEWFAGDEERGLESRPTRELAHLALALDEKRKTFQPDKPAIEARGECGAGEQPFILRSEPAGAKIWIATRFAYNLCNVHRIDGWNRATCARWTETDPAVPAALSGTYMYQARWPDGRQARGSKTLDGLNPDDDDGAPVIVTIRPE